MTNTNQLTEALAEGAYQSVNGEHTRWEDVRPHIRESFVQTAHDMLPFVLPIIAAEVRAAKAEALREMQEHHEREADKAQTITARGIHLTIADGARKRADDIEKEN